MRLLILYLRSRYVLATLATATASVTTLGRLGHAADTPSAAGILGAVSVTAAVIAAGPGLAGADPDLERTAAIAWPPRRAAHLITVGVVVISLAVAAGDTSQTTQIVRDTAGMTGLLALGATALGTTRSWIVPMTWTVLAWMAATSATGARLGETHREVLFWMFQPEDSATAGITATALATAGLLTYTCKGARG